MQGQGEGAAEGPESFRSEWETAFDDGFVLREDLTWSKCWHSLRSVVFSWDSGFLITHDDLIEKNPIKSEELPASEYTMRIEDCSSKKSRDDLQLLVTTVQIQWLGKWQYIQDFFFSYCFCKREFLTVYDGQRSVRVLHTGSHTISSWQYWSFEWTKAVLLVSQGPFSKVV